MRRILHALTLFASIFIFATHILAQSPPAPAASSTAKQSADTFASLDGRFTIKLPAQVSAYSSPSQNTPAGRAEGQSFTWKTALGNFNVTYLDRPEQLEANSKTVLDAIRAQFTTQAGERNGRLASERELSLNNHPGREFKIDFPTGIFLSRTYLEGRRIYQLSVIIADDKRARETEAASVLDTFKLLDPAEVQATRRRQAEEATPAPLPQTPAVKKLKSDAEDEGLRGRVKMVFTESEDLSGTWAVGGRKPSSAAYFNEAGNLTKRELYDSRGNLGDITAYGYIDGQRVSKIGSITREYNPPAGFALAPAGQPKPKHDPRYTYRFTYKYDEKGNLSERVWLHSNGTVWLRYVYNLRGNERERLVYSADGSLNQKYVSLLDDKGNEVEEAVYDVKDDVIRSKNKFVHEFDAQGNWTKRVTSKLDSKNGKTEYQPAYVTYRTITYY